MVVDRTTYQESMKNYRIHTVTQTRTFSLPSRPSNLRSGSDGPWNPVEPYRVPWFEPGFVAFAPSPGPAVDQFPEETPSEMTVSPLIPDSKSKKPDEKFRPRRITTKEKGKAKEHEWERAAVRNGGFKFISEGIDEDTNHRSGGRKGKLAPKAAEKARKIRKLGACWSCWIMKVPVSFFC